MRLRQVCARTVDDDRRAAGQPGIHFHADAVAQAVAGPTQRETAKRFAPRVIFREPQRVSLAPLSRVM